MDVGTDFLVPVGAVSTGMVSSAALGFALILVAAAPDAADAARLAAGDVLVRKPAPDTVRIIAVIDAPPEKLWAIITDCGNYKTTMPGIAASELLTADGNTMTCKVTADVPFPLPDLVSVTRVTLKVSADRFERTWTLVEGDYDRNEGSWLLERHGPDGKKTLATYTVNAKPRLPLPESVVKRAQESKLPDMMRSLRARVTAPAATSAPAPRQP